MVTANESLESKYPSLRLAYEQVRGVLSEQEQTASTLDTKVATLFAISTAIFGIGMPLILGLLNPHGVLKVSEISPAVFIGGITAILVGCVLLSYLAVVRRALSAYRLRSFITMNNPEEIRLKMWHVDQPEFCHEILLNIERAFYENDTKLTHKAQLVDSLMDWLEIEIVSFLSLLLFLALLKGIGLV